MAEANLAAPSIHRPSSSGPRWRSQSAIAVSVAASTGQDDKMPAIPHIVRLPSALRNIRSSALPERLRCLAHRSVGREGHPAGPVVHQGFQRRARHAQLSPRLGTVCPSCPDGYFLVYNVPPGTTRGGHAHRQCEQYLIAVRGSVSVTLDDGGNPVRIFYSNGLTRASISRQAFRENSVISTTMLACWCLPLNNMPPRSICRTIPSSSRSERASLDPGIGCRRDL